MADTEWARVFEELGGWDGFDVARVSVEASDRGEALEDGSPAELLGAPSRRLIIELRAKPDVPKRCSRCGEIVVEVHDVSLRRAEMGRLTNKIRSVLTGILIGKGGGFSEEQKVVYDGGAKPVTEQAAPKKPDDKDTPGDGRPPESIE